MKALSILITILIPLAAATRANANDPMDLARTEARWISVQVINALPGERHPRPGPPARAWYAVGDRPGERVVTVPGPEVERIFFANRSPVDRSFSDFVWVFDAETGHVLSASFTGMVSEPVWIGPLQATARVAIAARLSTRMPGGYRRPRRIAGRTVTGYCADSDLPECTAVEPAAYDPETGWVRANGAVCASWRSLRTLAYTTMGQARFLELNAYGAPERPVRMPADAPPHPRAQIHAPSC